MKMNDRGWVLREFCYPEDYPAVIQLWETAGPGIHIGRSDTPDEIQKKLERDPDLFLLAEDAGRIIGSVIGGFDGRRGMVYHLAVAPEHRQRGIGAALMDEVESRLRQKGCIRYYLMVLYDNSDAIRFYEARGWERMELFTYAKNL
jgi:ribosomal protein S18 acetylase RimI-like enzyme